MWAILDCVSHPFAVGTSCVGTISGRISRKRGCQNPAPAPFLKWLDGLWKDFTFAPEVEVAFSIDFPSWFLIWAWLLCLPCVEMLVVFTSGHQFKTGADNAEMIQMRTRRVNGIPKAPCCSQSTLFLWILSLVLFSNLYPTSLASKTVQMAYNLKMAYYVTSHTKFR